MNAFAHLETPLDEAPLFPVEAPDGRKDWPEDQRQATFFRLLHLAGPTVLAFPVPNAGKRNPMKARREGIVGGVLDIMVMWEGAGRAMVELKGYSKAGRPGELQQNQIDFGNRAVRIGCPVACFFEPINAISWLRDQGAPIGRITV